MNNTTDYGFTAYLTLVKNCKPKNATKIRRGKMQYGFDLDDKLWTVYRVEYSESMFARFLQEIKLRKDASF